MWQPGTTVVHQETWRGKLWAARPLIVVQDTAELSVLWMPHGTVRKVPDGAHIDPNYPVSRKDRIIADLARGDWHYEDHTWEVSTLVTMRPADSYAVWTSWLPDGTHFGYYVNLQLPYRRTPIGFEAMDLMLDIVVQPDLSWQWKDDDEFEEIIELGLYSQDLARWLVSFAAWRSASFLIVSGECL